jgi:hypothetical protein
MLFSEKRGYTLFGHRVKTKEIRTARDVVNFMLYKKVNHGNEGDPKPENPRVQDHKATTKDRSTTYREAILTLTS